MARRIALNDPESVIKAISEDGGVILTDFAIPLDVERVNNDAAPYIQAILKNRSPGSPPETALCTRLFGRSTTAREVWLQQPNLHKVLNHFLRTVTKPYHYPVSAEDLVSDPTLSAAATMNICPGGKAQALHRDDWIWQQRHGERTPDMLDDEVSMGILVPGVDTIKSNGATMFVPGSHLWDHSRKVQDLEAVAAEMKVGEAFIFLGSTVHGGGANNTGQSRPTHGFFFCRSYIRPEENQHLWFTRDEVKTWSPAAQKQAGYILDNPNIGHCDSRHPLDLFRANDPDMQ